MKIKLFSSALFAATFGVLNLVTGPAAAQSAIATNSTYLRGVNVIDIGNAGEVLPGVEGKHYTRPTLEGLKALKGRGLQVIRLTFSWERLQPTLGGPLNARYLSLITGTLTDANSIGLKVLLDMHNFAHYMQTDKGTYLPIGVPGGPTAAHLADVWKKISAAVRGNSSAYNAVYAYELMNEPYYEAGIVPPSLGKTDMKVWEEAAQTAVTGLRSLGDNKLIHVAGIYFSNARMFPVLHPKPFITDPANAIMYHTHMYPDSAQSGGFALSHAEEEARAHAEGDGSVPGRAIKRIKAFANWCKLYKQQCFIGEIGWPNAESKGASEAAAWNLTGEEIFNYLDSIQMGATMWTTGSWLAPLDNVNNIYVLPRTGYAFQALSQSKVLEAHLGKIINTSASNLACVPTMSNADYVKNLYRLALGRELDAAGESYWTGSLNNGSKTRREVLRAIYYSAEYVTRMDRQLIHPAGATGVMSDLNFIKCAYAVLLGRDADSGGLTFFNNMLDQGTSRGDFVQNVMASVEFQNRLK